MAHLASLILTFVLIGCIAAIFVLLCYQIQAAAKKAKVDTGLSIQCGSGDSEIMTFSVNFLENESKAEKAAKMQEAFGFIQTRRDQNHAAYLQLKAEAIAENEAKIASGQKLTLKSITQEEVMQ